MTEIKAVTFDLWQTLMLDTKELGEARAKRRVTATLRELSNAGTPAEESLVWKAYTLVGEAQRGLGEQGMDFTFREQVWFFLESVMPKLPTQLGPGRIKRIEWAYGDDAFLSLPPPLAKGALNLLRKLTKQGYLLGLISNTGSTPGNTLRSYLKANGVLSYFNTLTFSDEICRRKPSVEMFQETVSSLGVTPQEVVHVGDHPTQDVSGALGAGLHAVWLKRNMDLEPPGESDAVITDLSELSEVLAALQRDSEN